MILITGGVGYIGSHIALSLRNSKRHSYSQIMLMDDLSGTPESQVERVRTWVKPAEFKQLSLDPLTAADVTGLLLSYRISAVIHCAGLKSGPDSLHDPGTYFGRNLASTYVLVEACKSLGLPLVYSSSASVYDSSLAPVPESAPLCPTTPYAWTKCLGEQLVQSVAHACSLRYFNPVGTVFSTWGEAWGLAPSSVVHRMCEASYRKEVFYVFGSDYPTLDGSPVRDFINVMDLADAHVQVLDDLLDRKPVQRVMNVGTGQGVTVKELADTFRLMRPLEVHLQPRRDGDIPVSVANADLIRRTTDWRPRTSLVTSLKQAITSFERSEASKH